MDNMSHISIGNVLPNRICHGILSLLAYIELHNFFNCCIEVTYRSLHIFNVCNLINLDKYPLSFNFTMIL